MVIQRPGNCAPRVPPCPPSCYAPDLNRLDKKHFSGFGLPPIVVEYVCRLAWDHKKEMLIAEVDKYRNLC